jgi:hypothetical protein
LVCRGVSDVPALSAASIAMPHTSVWLPQWLE